MPGCVQYTKSGKGIRYTAWISAEQCIVAVIEAPVTNRIIIEFLHEYFDHL